MRPWVARRLPRILVAILAAAAAATAATAEDVPAPPSAPATLEATLDAASALTLADGGARVANGSLKIGHIDLTFADGTASPIRGKDGSVLGFYFEGRGGYTYTADDPADRETLRTNIERTAKSLRMNGAVVTDTFHQVLVLFTEPMFRDVWGVKPGSAPAPLPDKAAASTAEMLARAKSSYPEFDFRLADVRVNGQGRWVYIEMAGGLERVGYCYDDVVDGHERLFNFRKLADYKVRFTQTLSLQFVKGWSRARTLRTILRHAAISVETDDNKTGTIVSDLTYDVRRRGTRLLALSLLSNRDPDSASWDSPKMALHVTRVVDDMGNVLPFSHKYGELVVEIARTTTDDAAVQIHVETQGEVFVDFKGRHADNYFVLLFDWYPAPAASAGQQFTYSLQVKTRKPWRPVTSGREISLKEDGDFYVADSRGDVPTSLVSVLAGRYVTHEETIDGLPIRVHGYAMAKKNVMDNIPKLAAAIVKYYTGLLGPMPAKELDIVEVPEYGFGISPAGMVLITGEAYKPRRNDIARYISRGINARLAHEIAHKWFGNDVIPLDPGDDWLSESFAEYYSGLAMGALAGKSHTVWSFENSLADWRDDDAICGDVAPIATADYLGGERAFMERRCLLYMRGPLVLHMLRTMVGDERFNHAVRSFIEEAHHGPATTDDLAATFSRVVGTDMRWFFDEWYRDTGIPTLEVDTSVSAGPKGTYRLSGTIHEAPGEHFKKMLVPIAYTLDGKRGAKVVFVDKPETSFDYSLPGRPSGVKVDPYRNNIAVYK